MNIRFPIYAFVILLVGCNRQDGTEALKKLSGSWIVEDNSRGDHFKNTITIDSSGSYVAHVTVWSHWDGSTRTSNLAGRFEIRDGLLIDTITKHSNTNAVLPIISSAHIVRLDRQELVIKYEASKEKDFPTNEIVFRKEER